MRSHSGHHRRTNAEADAYVHNGGSNGLSAPPSAAVKAAGAQVRQLVSWREYRSFADVRTYAGSAEILPEENHVF